MDFDRRTHINKLIDKEIKNRKDVNFMTLIHFANQRNLSITATYEPLTYSFINHKETINFEDFYFGMSPLFNNDIIHDIVTKRLFKTKEDFNKYIDEYYYQFMLYDNLKKYINPLHKKVILQAISKFGIECKYKDANTFQYIMSNFSDINHKLIKYTKFEEPFYILGSISDNLLELFYQKQISFSLENTNIVVSCDAKNLFDFNDPVILDHNYKLCYGDAFYSGVMLKLMKNIMDSK